MPPPPNQQPPTSPETQYRWGMPNGRLILLTTIGIIILLTFLAYRCQENHSFTQTPQFQAYQQKLEAQLYPEGRRYTRNACRYIARGDTPPDGLLRTLIAHYNGQNQYQFSRYLHRQ